MYSHPALFTVLNLNLLCLFTLLLFLKAKTIKPEKTKLQVNFKEILNKISLVDFLKTCSGCPVALGALPAPVANRPWMSTAVLQISF